jgi:hypothetical protein
MERQREAHYRELDRQLAAGARKLEASQLAVTVESLRRQTADALAELEDDGPDEEQPPELARPQQLGPEAEAAQVAAAGIWSPEFRAWHEAHAAPSSRGLFQ